MIYCLSFLWHNNDEFNFSFNKWSDRIDIWIGCLNIVWGTIISSKNISSSIDSAVNVEMFGSTLNPKSYKDYG